MATFILLSAIPGSGKSTWAKQYQKEHPNTHIVASDDVRRRVAGGVQHFQCEPLVWETFLKEINDWAEKDPSCTVIADATNLQNKYRVYYHDMTPKFDKHILVLFNIPFEICEIQNKMRPADTIVPEDGMAKLEAEFETPTQEVIDLYDEYWVIGKSFVSEELKHSKIK